jgi:RNA polymerase sigma-70 factor (ECF subfamily)
VLTDIEPKSSDFSLVRAAQNGDNEAFGALYQEYGHLIHGILLAHVTYQDAEDLVQDVFMKALKQLPSLREPAAFCGWLIAIARRTAIDHLRKIKPNLRAEPVSSATKSETGAVAILNIIQKLPEAYRETLILRLVEGMTGPEIAARTGLTPDSVRVNLCRGMKLLRSQLETPAKL